jgi:hypothetical protein
MNGIYNIKFVVIVSQSRFKPSTSVIQGVAIECCYFKFAVLMNCIEHKHRILRSVSSKMSFNICRLVLNNSSPRGMKYILVILIGN